MPSYDHATRHVLTERLRAMLTAGTSLRGACAALSIPPATGKLWLDTLAERGHIADGRRDASGRKPVCPLAPAEANALRSLVLQKRMSEESAIRAFPAHPACSPATAAFIRHRLSVSYSAPRTEAKKERWPASLRRAAHVTRGDRDRWQGTDATRAGNIHARRDLTIIMPDGRPVAMRPHTMWQFDDYSTNQPYYLEYAEGKFRLCRQVLAGYDAFTGGWLCFLHVGKEKDQYTGGDCLRVVHLAMESHGTRPDIIILEQGRWKSNAVQGLQMPNGRRWGALSDCGVIVHYAMDSNGKAEIEGAFHTLQVELDGGADIGHTRGLHERESDNYLAVNQGRRDPRLCGFRSLTASEEAHYTAAALLNARRKERRELGYASADELFAEFPVERRPLAPADRWLFLPHKQEATVGSISSGLVGCKVNGRQYLFVVNGVAPGVHLDDGHRVYIAFDPERPQMGCVVGNADSSTINRESHRMGQLLLGGTAPPAMPWETMPRLDLRSADDKQQTDTAHWKQRKAAINAAATSFRAILPGGKRGMRVVTQRSRAADEHVRDTVMGSEHDTTEAAAELSAAYRGEHLPAAPASQHIDNLPRIDGNRPLRADGGEDSPPAIQRATARFRAPDADDDFEALEAAAMRAAGVLI